jgi:predicted 2-oxoglutarate/Fe(II)-dependent dioxygenase YbiX
MFGTLVVQLPSEYVGGELVVYDDSDKKSVFDFGQTTGKRSRCIHYAAHYADVEHEVLKVTKGHRLALVYSLCWETINDKIVVMNKRDVDHEKVRRGNSVNLGNSVNVL